MKLHCHPISPYARKAMILARLHELAIDEVIAKADGARGYTGGINPLGKIPALETEMDGLIFDSPVICEYIDNLSKTSLLPKNQRNRINQLRLHALGDGISDAVYNYRYETVRDESLHWDKQIKRHNTALEMSVAYLNNHIDDLGVPWEFGNLSIICALDYMSYRAGHVEWKNTAPALARWYDQFIKDSVYLDTYAF